MINAFFTEVKDPGKNSFQPLALAGLEARILGSHPGYPGSIPGQGIKISLPATTHCCLSEISLNKCAHFCLHLGCYSASSVASVPLKSLQCKWTCRNFRLWFCPKSFLRQTLAVQDKNAVPTPSHEMLSFLGREGKLCFVFSRLRHPDIQQNPFLWLSYKSCCSTELTA